MPETPNPYIAGSPVTGPEMFFGREDVFTFVRQALTGQHRDHVLVLYGQRRTGKTSVLYQMSRHLGERYVCIFIDLHGLALNGLSGFLWELANHITRVLRRDYQISLPALDRAAFQDEPRSAFENTFLDSVWAEIGDRHLLLMLDEAIRLEEQVKAGKLDIQVFDYLRHLMQHHPRLNFLFSLGSGLEEMQKEYAFLFNVALYKKISFLDRASAEALITEPVKGGCPFHPAAVERILDVTSGHPYFIQLICHSLFNRCQGAGGVTLPDVEGVLDEAVERGLAVLKHVWEDSTPGEKAVLAALAAAPGASRTGDPAQSDSVRVPLTRSEASSGEIIQTWAERGVTLPESEAARAVRSLVARDVIAGAGAYAFTVDLMRLWVQKFRRLDWVKEEIEDAARVWAQRDQERRNREALEQGEPLSSLQGERAGEINTAAGNAAGGAVLRKPFISTAVYILVALAGLLGIVYFTSGLLTGRTLNSGLPVNPAEAQREGSSVILSGAAAQVSDLVVLDGYVWAATEGGLVRWSADGTYRPYPVSDLGLDCINALVADPSDNILWLGCGGVAVARLEGDEPAFFGSYNRDDGLGMGAVRALAIDPRGDIWAGGAPTQGRPPPLTVFTGSSADQPWMPVEEINVHLAALFGSSPQSININSILVNSDDSIWLGLREAGIVFVNEQGANLYSEAAGVGKPGLADRRIRQLLADKNGTIWAAASDQGLLRFGDQVWDTIEVVPGGAPIRTVTEFADGSLWAAGDRLVVRSDDGGATWTQVGTQDGLGSDIGALVQDETGQVWAGAYNGGVSVWDGQSWRALQR